MTKNLVDQILELENNLRVGNKEEKIFVEFVRALDKETNYSCSIISFEDFENLKKKNKLGDVEYFEDSDRMSEFKFHQLLNSRAKDIKSLKEFILSYNPRVCIRPTWEWVSDYYSDYRSLSIREEYRRIPGLGFLSKLSEVFNISSSASVSSDDIKRVNSFIAQTFKKHGKYFYTFPDERGVIATEFDKESKSQMAVIYLMTKEIGDCLTSVSDSKSKFSIRIPGECVGWGAIFKCGGLELQTCPFGVILYSLKPERKVEGIRSIFYEYSKEGL